MMRQCLLLLVAALCAFWLPSQQAQTQELRRILYGTTASPSQLPVWVAKDAGYFEKQGLDVEPVQIRGGSLITVAILTGNLQFSAAGAEIVLLACPVDVDPVYLIVRPEIKSAAELKGKPAGITRYGSTTHFYLRTALKNIGLDPERDILIMQLGAGPEMVVALQNGAIATAALTHRYALPFLERGWPVLVDLSKTDLVYPSSCVTSSRDFVKAEPTVVQNFLRGYIAGINLIKRDHGFAQKSFAKWMREKDLAIVKKTVETYARLYKPVPYVPDKGIDNVLKDMVVKRPELKQYLGWPEFFRENKPLETVLREK